MKNHEENKGASQTQTQTKTGTVVGMGVDHKSSKKRSFDLRTWTLTNLRALMAIVGGVILVSLAIGGYNYYQGEKNNEINVEIYSFRTNVWDKYQKGSLPDAEFVSKWNELLKKVDVRAGIEAMSIEIGNYLIEKNRLSQAEEVLKPVLLSSKKNPYTHYFLVQSMVVIYEDTGRVDDAIKLLEELVKSKVKFLEPKIYFDLGRLYQQLGNKDKAKLNYQYVVDNFTQDYFAKLARAYLKRI